MNFYTNQIHYDNLVSPLLELPQTYKKNKELNWLLIADVFLTSIRWTVGGKTYYIHQQGPEGGHVYQGKTSFSTLKKIIGVVSSITFFPLVITGFIIKKSIKPQVQQQFNFLNSYIKTNPSLFIKEQIFQAPKPIQPTEKELRAVGDTNWQLLCVPELMKVWKEVDSGKDWEKKGQNFEIWLRKIVPSSFSYKYIPIYAQDEACETLKRNITLILLQFKNNPKLSNEKKKEILDLMEEESKVCSPTWLEIAEKSYQICRGADSLKQRILRHLETVKENMILHAYQEKEKLENQKRKTGEKKLDWNQVLNPFRFLAGKEVGLRKTDSSKFDNHTIIQFRKRRDKENLLRLFYAYCTPKQIVQGLTNEINLENVGTNGYDKEIGAFLGNKEAVFEHAKRNGIDTDENFDSSLYILNTFFTSHQNHYSLNEEGAKMLLSELNFLS